MGNVSSLQREYRLPHPDQQTYCALLMLIKPISL
jgi:hypothetical protein